MFKFAIILIMWIFWHDCWFGTQVDWNFKLLAQQYMPLKHPTMYVWEEIASHICNYILSKLITSLLLLLRYEPDIIHNTLHVWEWCISAKYQIMKLHFTLMYIFQKSFLSSKWNPLYTFQDIIQHIQMRKPVPYQNFLR